MTVNNGYHPHGRAMFSPAALAAFKQFVKIDNATVAQRPKGAQDAMTPGLRRALKQSGVTPDRLRTALKNVGLAFDQMESEGAGPDPEHVRRILDCVREALGDLAKHKVAKVIQNKWPESMLPDDNENDMGEENDDDMTDDDFPSQTELADADEPSGNPNRNRDYAGRGSEAFRVANDDPPDFPGMPKPGGSMVPIKKKEMAMASDAAMNDYFRMFPDAARIKLNNYGPETSPAYFTPQYVRPAHAKANGRGMAMDAAEHTAANSAEDDYERVFGRGSSTIVEV